MHEFLFANLPNVLFVVLISIGAGIAIAAYTLWARSVRYRKNPLTITLLRSPGYSLRLKIDDLNWDVSGLMLLSTIVPVLIVFEHIAQSYFSKRPDTISHFVITFTLLAVTSIYLVGKLIRKLRDREDLCLGYDAERATGQELQKLALNGYHIYHDIPAGKFNIDHVVVGRTGVYAVETKGRSKRWDQPGKDGAKVIYDGESLRFPGWTEKAPIEQAKNNADWLSKELSQALGETVKVKPVLCICGWFVERSSKNPPIVYNGTKPESVFPKIEVQALGKQTIDRICYQIEQWVGDVEPSAYKQSTN